MAQSEDQQGEIETFLKNFSRCYEYQDEEAILKLYSSSPKTVLIGSMKKERYVGPAQIRQAYRTQFKKTEPVLLDFSIIAWDKRDSAGWLAAECFVLERNKKKKVKNQARLTLVLEKEIKHGNWAIVQHHLSFPSPI